MGAGEVGVPPGFEAALEAAPGGGHVGLGVGCVALRLGHRRCSRGWPGIGEALVDRRATGTVAMMESGRRASRARRSAGIGLLKLVQRADCSRPTRHHDVKRGRPAAAASGCSTVEAPRRFPSVASPARSCPSPGLEWRIEPLTSSSSVPECRAVNHGAVPSRLGEHRRSRYAALADRTCRLRSPCRASRDLCCLPARRTGSSTPPGAGRRASRAAIRDALRAVMHPTASEACRGVSRPGRP